MEKQRWLNFLSARLRSQIILENAEKAQTWALAIVCFAVLGTALKTVGEFRANEFAYAAKVLFFIFFHVILIAVFYLPGVLMKGEKAFQRLFGVYDLTSLTFFTTALTFYSAVLLMLGLQMLTVPNPSAASPFFQFVSWVNLLVAAGYLAACLVFALSFIFLPQVAMRVVEFTGKGFYALLGVHAGLLLFLAIGYSGMVTVGSADFFEQLRVVGLFWIFIMASLALNAKVLRRSSVQTLAGLELEVAAGRLDRDEDVLARFKEAFVSRRLSAWSGRLSHRVASLAHDIAGFTHEAVRIVSQEKPREIDLRLVEDRYRRAEVLYKKLEKENRRFVMSLSLFDLSEAEREQLESLKDLFSRELRNAKLELASVRKRIDDRLEALKNQEIREAPLAPPAGVKVSETLPAQPGPAKPR